MATGYGIASTLVTSTLVNQVTINSNTTLESAETGNLGPNGGYQVKISNGGHGCGNSGVFVELLDTIPWTNITYEVILTGDASCWVFNHPGGSYGPGGGGNILAYNEALGDRISRPLNSWEIPATAPHDRTYACNNANTNFMRSAVSPNNPRTFFMQRRRDVNGSLAGPQHGRACVSAGTTIIRNIRIW